MAVAHSWFHISSVSNSFFPKYCSCTHELSLPVLFIQGLPIFYMELAIGQRLRKGAIGVWNEVSPYLGGIGIASAIVSFIVALYYNTIIAWCLTYFLHSFESPLPWAHCPRIFDEHNMTFSYERECNVSDSSIFPIHKQEAE